MSNENDVVNTLTIHPIYDGPGGYVAETVDEALEFLRTDLQEAETGDGLVIRKSTHTRRELDNLREFEGF